MSREAVADAIRGASRITAICHENPDADTLGSALALRLAAERLGKRGRGGRRRPGAADADRPARICGRPSRAAARPGSRGRDGRAAITRRARSPSTAPSGCRAPDREHRPPRLERRAARPRSPGSTRTRPRRARWSRSSCRSRRGDRPRHRDRPHRGDRAGHAHLRASERHAAHPAWSQPTSSRPGAALGDAPDDLRRQAVQHPGAVGPDPGRHRRASRRADRLRGDDHGDARRDRHQRGRFRGLHRPAGVDEGRRHHRALQGGRSTPTCGSACGRRRLPTRWPSPRPSAAAGTRAPPGARSTRL